MVDGNKRLGCHVMLVFLVLNGYEMEYTQKELSDLILDVVADRKRYEDILQWLLVHQM
jgi:death-on-curing protein